MKTNQVSIGKQRILFSGLFAFFAALWPALVFAQWDFAPPTTPNAQRNALNVVHSQVNCLQNKTRTASNLVGEQGYGSLRHEFEVLRLAYVEFARTLTPQQVERGAKSLVELNDGLDIIEGAFANYAEDIAAGKPAGAALHNLCGVLRQSSALWRKELDRTASRLRAGVERAGTTTPTARTMKPVGSTGTSCDSTQASKINGVHESYLATLWQRSPHLSNGTRVRRPMQVSRV
jgi:hypothetical protein